MDKEESMQTFFLTEVLKMENFSITCLTSGLRSVHGLCLGGAGAYQTGRRLSGLIIYLFLQSLYTFWFFPSVSNIAFPSMPNQVIHQKPKKSLKEITNDLCPVCNFFSNLLGFSIGLQLISCFAASFRCWAYSSYTESVQCTGMTNTVHKAYLRM